MKDKKTKSFVSRRKFITGMTVSGLGLADCSIMPIGTRSLLIDRPMLEVAKGPITTCANGSVLTSSINTRLSQVADFT